jgi:hypothetical protein
MARVEGRNKVEVRERCRHKLPELCFDSWCVGSSEEDCGIILGPDSYLSYSRGVDLDPGPWISIMLRRVSMCRRLKDHGRDKLAFSVSGWLQVQPPRNECSDSKCLECRNKHESALYGPKSGQQLRKIKRSCILVINSI